VQFADNGTNLGSPVGINSSGQASFTTSALAVGSHTITAVYSGDTNFQPSTSSLTQTVGQGYVLSVSPDKLTYAPSETITFGGNLATSSGLPVSGVQIGIDDPIAMACVLGPITDASGNFNYQTYTNSSSKGVYGFAFYALNTSKFAAVAVNPSGGLQLTDDDNKITLGVSTSASDFDSALTAKMITTNGWSSATQNQLTQSLGKITQFLATTGKNAAVNFFSNPANDALVVGDIGCTAVAGWTGLGIGLCTPIYKMTAVAGAKSLLMGAVDTAIDAANMTTSDKTLWKDVAKSAACVIEVIPLDPNSAVSDISRISTGWKCLSAGSSLLYYDYNYALTVVATPSASSQSQTSVGFVLFAPTPSPTPMSAPTPTTTVSPPTPPTPTSKPLPVLTSPLKITPAKDTYNISDILFAEFTITNRGTAPITLNVLTVGGRLNSQCPDGKCPDFANRQCTLQPNYSYHYEGALALTNSGNYHFFCAYYIENPSPSEKQLLDENNWNTNVDLAEGLTDKDRTFDISVPDLRLESVPTEHTGGIIIPRSVFPEGDERFIPIYVPEANNGSNVLQEGQDWRTIKEIVGTDIDFDWRKAVSSFSPSGAEEPKGAGISFGAALLQAIDEGTSVLELKTTVQKNSQGYFRAIIQLGDPMSKTYMRKYAGQGYIDLTSSFWLAEDVFSDVIAEKFGLDPDNYPFNYYVMALNLDGSHRGDEFVGYISVSQDNKIVLTPRLYPQDRLKIMRIHKVVLPYEVETVVEFTGNGLLSFTKSQLDNSTVKSILNVLTPMFLMADSGTIIRIGSPCELRVYDSENRVTGLVDGDVREEIPDSYYCADSETVIIFGLAHSYRYELVGKETGKYDLVVVSVQKGLTETNSIAEVPISKGASDRYVILVRAVPEDEKTLIRETDSNGDGVFDNTSVIKPPIASFTWSPEKPATGEKMIFDASGSHDGDGHIVAFQWDLGDGHNVSSTIVNHTYKTGGDYPVSLTIRDNDGACSTFSTVVHVEQSNMPWWTIGVSIGAIIALVLALVFFLRRKRGETVR